MFVGVTINGEVEEIGTDSTVVEQCIAFAGRTVSAQLCALLLALNQEGQKLALRVMNSRGKPGVAPDILESDIAFVSEQYIDPRRYRVRGVGAAKISTKRSAMGREVLDVKHFEAVLTCEAIDRNEGKV